MPISTTGSLNSFLRFCLSASARYLRRPQVNGFTLMELVVVMVLLSLLTVFAVPRIRSSLFTDQLKNTARRLIALVNETGQAARSEHQPYLLIFDSGSQVFHVRADTRKKDNPQQTIRDVHVPAGIRIVDFVSVHGGKRDSGELTLWFSKNGYVDKTLIHFQDDAGRELTLALSPFLGVSRLYDSYRTLEQDIVQ